MGEFLCVAIVLGAFQLVVLIWVISRFLDIINFYKQVYPKISCFFNNSHWNFSVYHRDTLKIVEIIRKLSQAIEQKFSRNDKSQSDISIVWEISCSIEKSCFHVMLGFTLSKSLTSDHLQDVLNNRSLLSSNENDTANGLIKECLCSNI